VLIPVTAVGRVAMRTVHVVDVVAVINSFVAAPGAVLVVVRRVGHVLVQLALVPVAVMLVMCVSVVQVVGVTVVTYRDMPAPFSVRVRVIGMVLVTGRGHCSCSSRSEPVNSEPVNGDCSCRGSLPCAMASRAM
jgi:hypothetical protein